MRIIFILYFIIGMYLMELSEDNSFFFSLSLGFVLFNSFRWGWHEADAFLVKELNWYKEQKKDHVEKEMNNSRKIDTLSSQNEFLEEKLKTKENTEKKDKGTKS